MINPEKKKELSNLINEFAETHLKTEEAVTHLINLKHQRIIALAHYKELAQAKKDGEDITDRVLLWMLPYKDSASNKERGAWVHIAPVVTKDVKTWFESKNWAKQSDWPLIAQAIFSFVSQCIENPNNLVQACDSFSNQVPSKGFQSGIMSPILNALCPKQLLLVNKKPRKVLKHFTSEWFASNIVEYPAANKSYAGLIEEVSDILTQIKPSNCEPADLFDLFCHWFVAVKKYELGAHEKRTLSETTQSEIKKPTTPIRRCGEMAPLNGPLKEDVPNAGGLRTVFKKVDYDLSGILHYIDIGDIGLPDIQRPFIWKSARVRDLFDSMYRGFPVGYLLFWENGSRDTGKKIGVGDKQHVVPRLLIVDGQQRLTSLYSVLRGKEILDSDYRTWRIEIAFRPLDSKFEVADAAIRRDPEFISDISALWTSGSSSRKLINDYLKNLSSKRVLTESDEEIISHNLDRLCDLHKYPFTALEVSPSVDEEEVADIFVRINSEGIQLNQADFILTLLSVFWDEGRKELETFSRLSYQPAKQGEPPSPFNHFIQPGPDQLLRVAVAFGFLRGRLKSVYQVLRGKDLDTGEFSADRRETQFTRLKESQTKVLDLTNWHQFLSSLVGAGFRSGELVSSQNALLYAYAFYLTGRIKHQIPEHSLQKLMGRWFYATTLSGRYTGSPETVMDGDLNRIKDVKDADQFVTVLDKIINDALTTDFWNITLPNNLDSSSARSPELFAYLAAQNKLGAPVLFSHKKVSDLLDPTIKQKRKAIEKHHLFPRAWLEIGGITDLKLINQVGNFALLEWPDNTDISKTPPAEYVPILKARFDESSWQTMCDLHALPEGWERMAYEEFLNKRRPLMAQIIKRGYESMT